MTIQSAHKQAGRLVSYNPIPGITATPLWYDELEFYIDDSSVDYTTNPNEATGHFTQASSSPYFIIEMNFRCLL